VLIGEVVRWADTIRPSRIVLCVREANVRAKALYRRHGFADGGPADSASPDEPPERWMVRTVGR
jgi:ribosomal protein S18 acetylase RimI-like enzyme